MIHDDSSWMKTEDGRWSRVLWIETTIGSGAKSKDLAELLELQPGDEIVSVSLRHAGPQNYPSSPYDKQTTFHIEVKRTRLDGDLY